MSKTADTLSAALTRVSSYDIDQIDGESDDKVNREPDVDGGRYELVRRLHCASIFGLCGHCEGVRDHGSNNATDTAGAVESYAIARARERAQDQTEN
ncbi:hypothetical protein [Silicimonas algicola]|uniref:hypothetical protein n=1 Tax=Silicimonas algicola TaxID=1826607 RepID=UPI0013E0D283|nr:hypothetical protein [Silicimonas algicola]